MAENTFHHLKYACGRTESPAKPPPKQAWLSFEQPYFPSKLPMAVAALKEPELTAACNLLLSGWSWHSSICNLRSLNNPVSKIILLASLCKEHIIRAALTISVEIALAASS